MRTPRRLASLILALLAVLPACVDKVPSAPTGDDARVLSFNTAATSIGSGFTEDFATAVLDPAWTVIPGARYPGGYPNYGTPVNDYSLTANPGHLRYTLNPMSHDVGFLNGYAVAPRPQLNPYYGYDPGLEIYRPISGDQWMLEAKGTFFLPCTNGRGLNLLVHFGPGGTGTTSAGWYRGRDLCPPYYPGQNFLIASVRYQPGTTAGDLTYEGPAQLVIPPDGPDVSTYYLRIERAGGVLTWSYSSDGLEWTEYFTKDFGTSLDGLAQRVTIAGVSWFNAGDSYVDWDYINVTPTNRPPEASPGGPYTGDEGSPAPFNGALSSDPDGDALTYAWDFGDGSPASTDVTPSHIYLDNGTYTVCLTVTDPGGASDANCTTAEIANVAPSVGAITTVANPVPVGQTIDASVAFTDPGTADAHTAVIDWGDGESTPASAGVGSVSGNHAYVEAGVHTLNFRVTDDDGGVGTSFYQYVVVYDPNAGFVTGGGWINSPAGAYAPMPELSGKATFGFVSRYAKGASVPAGNTEFQFKAGDLNFRSASYDWLVVTGSNYARFKGEGTINAAMCPTTLAPYKFMIWAGDRSPDTFRIRIWCENSHGAETQVYDNGFDQGLGGGSIVVHSR